MSSSVARESAGSATREIAQVAVFAALIAVLGLPGQINLGGGAVPITLQTLGVMLAGSILGWRKGLFSVLTVIAVGIALPVLAGGRTTLVSLSAPTAGYLVGWIPAVIVIGILTALVVPRYKFIPGLVINVIGGIAIIYAFGTAGLMFRAELGVLEAIASNGLFLPGDAAKAVVAAIVAAQVHRARPGLIPPLRAR